MFFKPAISLKPFFSHLPAYYENYLCKWSAKETKQAAVKLMGHRWLHQLYGTLWKWHTCCPGIQLLLPQTSLSSAWKAAPLRLPRIISYTLSYLDFNPIYKAPHSSTRSSLWLSLGHSSNRLMLRAAHPDTSQHLLKEFINVCSHSLTKM